MEWIFAFVAVFVFGATVGYVTATQPSEIEMIARIKKIRRRKALEADADLAVMRDIEKL